MPASCGLPSGCLKTCLYWLSLFDFRSWQFRFSLRSLLIFVAVCSIACSFLVRRFAWIAEQRHIIASLEATGVTFAGHWDDDAGWLVFLSGSNSHPMLGTGWFGRVLGSDVCDTTIAAAVDHVVSPDTLASMGNLTRLERLSLETRRSTNMTYDNLRG